MRELEDHAQKISRAFVTSQQQEHDSEAQRSGKVDPDLTARLNELNRLTDERMRMTLSDIRASLQTKVYEQQLESRSTRQRPAKPGPHPNAWHAEIETVSRELFQDGHYRESVLNSFIRVIEAVRQKSRIQDDGDSLMGHAFGGDLARPQGSPQNRPTEGAGDLVVLPCSFLCRQV